MSTDSLLLNKIDTLNFKIQNLQIENSIRMSNKIMQDSIFEHKLDSIAQNVSRMNHSFLVADSSKSILIIATFATPLVVGFILFILNRNKEHHSKKSELCGDIYGKILELKNVIADLTQSEIFKVAYSRIIDIQGDEEYNADGPPEDNEIPQSEYIKRLMSYLKQIVKHQTLQRKIISELAKSIGQYRLYLPPRKREIFDELVKPVQGMSSITYDFSKSETVNKVEQEILIKRKNFRKDLAEIHSTNIDKLQKFIDENSGAVLIEVD